MISIVESIDNFFNERADQRVSNWLMLSSVWPTICIILIYSILIFAILPAYMKNRTPYNLTTVIRIYNLMQIFSCSLIIYWIVTSGWIQGDYELSCQPIDYSNRPRALSTLRALQWNYFLKLTELVETIFFLLRKKFNQVTFLHVYHHISSALLMWIGCKFVGGGMVGVPVILNCFIHIWMYLYYYLSSLGPTWQKTLNLWKQRLTIAQMVQFTILILHAMMVLRPSCVAPRGLALLYIPNVVFVFKMFYDFYNASYRRKKQAK